ncbi:MAG: hypothetical protein H5T86_10640 [Armatimonadetes bacterium]|nr:hypothetical protein [Armatimonadota bacterium]
MQGFGVLDLVDETPEIRDVLLLDMLAREYGWTPKEIFGEDPDVIEALAIVVSERIRLLNKNG